MRDNFSRKIYVVHGNSSNDMSGRSTVVLVGSTLSFPETLVRILHSEFPEIEFVRLASFTDYEPPNLFAPQAPLAVVVDESRVDELTGVIRTYCNAHGPFTVAFAYRNLFLARELLIGQGGENEVSDVRFLPMNIQFDRWLSVFRLMLSGDGFMPYELLSTAHNAQLDGTVEVTDDAPNSIAEVELTAREREVLTLVAEGKQNKIIAEDLNLSVHTVKLHIHHLITKLGVHNRTEAALRYSALMQQSGQKSS